jgi:hypothetical protein
MGDILETQQIKHYATIYIISYSWLQRFTNKILYN